METSILRRRRILLHFFLGIGLPSLFLGYLAFRGIQNDIALLEKERLNEHNTIAQQITESINIEISAVEGAFLDSIADHQTPQWDSAVLGSLERLKSHQPLVEEIFFFEHAERIQLPLAKLLFLPGRSAKSLPVQPRPSAFLAGQQYEFQQKRFQEALTYLATRLDEEFMRDFVGRILTDNGIKAPQLPEGVELVTRSKNQKTFDFYMNHGGTQTEVKIPQGKYEDIPTGTIHERTLNLAKYGVSILVKKE